MSTHRAPAGDEVMPCLCGRVRLSNATMDALSACAHHLAAEDHAVELKAPQGAVLQAATLQVFGMALAPYLEAISAEIGDLEAWRHRVGETWHDLVLRAAMVLVVQGPPAPLRLRPAEVLRGDRRLVGLSVAGCRFSEITLAVCLYELFARVDEAATDADRARLQKNLADLDEIRRAWAGLAGGDA